MEARDGVLSFYLREKCVTVTETSPFFLNNRMNTIQELGYL